jgi:hypothetical protein
MGVVPSGFRIPYPFRLGRWKVVDTLIDSLPFQFLTLFNSLPFSTWPMESG